MRYMTEDKAREFYHSGLDCGQLTFGYGLELLDMDPELGYRTAACFGGGMFHGDTCGCVTGSLMAIGMKYGHYKMDDSDTKDQMIKVKEEFERAFIEEYGSLICREILNCDISTDEGRVRIIQEGLLDTICPKLAVTACEILEELL